MLDIKEQIFTVDITKGDNEKKWFSCKITIEKLSFSDYMSSLQEGHTEVERGLAIARRSHNKIEGYPAIEGHKIENIADIFNLPAHIVAKNPEHIQASMRIIREITAQATMSPVTEKN